MCLVLLYPEHQAALEFSVIGGVPHHLPCTNFVRVSDRIGREFKGVPMGDALSCVALRLFTWKREIAVGRG